MISFEKITLSNGLRVLVNKDVNTPLAAFNILYDVGARDEQEHLTGFAHLFEHLMFSGSKNVPHFDKIVQLAGGTNNAFTSNDITNYYISLPVANIETAFYVDSDRLGYLDVSNKSVDVQKNVVIEEFNQRYLNQPYGDAMLLLRPMVYKEHPYRWATIGKSTDHIEQASLKDVNNFYENHYNPNRAILSISGNVDVDNMFRMAEKWFGNIRNKSDYQRSLPIESDNSEYRLQVVEKNVPVSAIYIGFLMCDRMDISYYGYDLISDVLSRGDSSRLHQSLVKDKQIMTSVNAYITGSVDQGMFIISGKVSEGFSLEEAEKAIFEELHALPNVSERELQKVKNKVVSSSKFEEVGALNKAMNLSYYELLGDANNANYQNDFYEAVSLLQFKKLASELFQYQNANVLHYKAIGQ